MPHPDLDELLNALVPFAQQMLSKHGEFYPFGASVDAKGEVRCVAGDVGDEKPESQDLIELLLNGFREEAKRGDIRAAAICYDVRIVPPGQKEKTDAIALRLEHKDGESLEAYVPYRKGFLGKYRYDDLFAGKGDRTIFA
jgi:hypothetical protein